MVRSIELNGMYFIKLNLNKQSSDYDYYYASNIEMNILGNFLSCDIRLRLEKTPFRTWVYEENWPGGYGNVTIIKKENDYIYLSELYSEEENPTELKMTTQQFIQLLDDWQEKVCKHKPKEVIIKYENNEFTIETKA